MSFQKAIRRSVMGSIFASLAMLTTAIHAEVPPDFNRHVAVPLDEETAPISAAARHTMIEIPPGTYPIGSDTGPADQRPRHQIMLASFRIDRTEVTNAAFAEFLNALDLDVLQDFEAGRIAAGDVATGQIGLLTEKSGGSNAYPIIALDDAEALIGARSGRFVPREGFDNHPVTETTWAGARAYCAWRGGRLPREVEWEAAARGPEGFNYPWGQHPPTAEQAFVSRRTGETAVVGTRPAGASPFGVLDMSGSLAEWTSTLKGPYPYRSNDGREDPARAGERVTRGGDYVFDTQPERLTATHRDGFSNEPSRGHRHIGLRCVEDVN